MEQLEILKCACQILEHAGNMTSSCPTNVQHMPDHGRRMPEIDENEKKKMSIYETMCSIINQFGIKALPFPRPRLRNTDR